MSSVRFLHVMSKRCGRVTVAQFALVSTATHLDNERKKRQRNPRQFSPLILAKLIYLASLGEDIQKGLDSHLLMQI